MFKNLLLVDDDEDDRDFFLTVIDTIDTTLVCEIAVNGKDALEKLMSNKVKPDLIFLDLNMPLMNGKQFLTELKNNTSLKDIPVVVLSTSADGNSKTEVQRLGAVEFITKPNKLSTLEERLKLLFTNPAFLRGS